MRVKDATFTFVLWCLLVTISLAEASVKIEYEPWLLSLGPYPLRPAKREPPLEPPPDDEDDEPEPEPLAKPRRRPRTRRAKAS